jgi:hypothetical protein
VTGGLRLALKSMERKGSSWGRARGRAGCVAGVAEQRVVGGGGQGGGRSTGS